MEKHQQIKFLKGKRVFARPIEQDDLDLFYKNALWDPEGRRLTGTQAFFSRQGVQKWFNHISTDASRVDLIICLEENDKPIGEMAILDIHHLNRSATVRISIFDKAYLGQGYGTEAMSLLLEYGFTMLNLHRIGLDVFSFNERAIKSYKKLGFKHEGRIRDELFYEGEYHDSILMGMLETEFQKNHEGI